MKHHIFKLSFCLSFFLCWGAFAQNKKGCSSKELDLKNCVLEYKNIWLGLGAQKIRFNVKPWTSIADFPSSEKVNSWQEARLKTIQGRMFLSLKTWRDMEKEVALEELYWVLFEVKEKSLVPLLEKPIGKRRKAGEGNGPRIQDKILTTTLKFQKEKFIWTVGSETGEL